MSVGANLVEITFGLLASAGRPLNLRRLHQLGAAEDRWPDGLSVADLEQALSNSPALVRSRGNVFARAEAVAEVEVSPAPSKQAAAPKVEAPKVEAPKVEAPKVEAPKVEAPKVEAPRYTPEAPKVEAPRYTSEAPKVEAPRYTSEAPKVEARKPVKIAVPTPVKIAVPTLDEDGSEPEDDADSGWSGHGNGQAFGDDEDEEEGGRKRRRVRTRDLVGSVPVAPLSVEEAVRMARKGDRNRPALRTKLWERMLAQATALTRSAPAAGWQDTDGSLELLADEAARSVALRPAATKAVDRDVAPKPSPVAVPVAKAAAVQGSQGQASPAAAPARPDPRQRMRDRLRQRSGDAEQVEVAEVAAGVAPIAAAPTPSEPIRQRRSPEPAPSSATLARVNETLAAAPAAKAPVAEASTESAPRPYVDERWGVAGPTADERRAPRFEAEGVSHPTAQAALEVLRSAGASLELEALRSALIGRGVAADRVRGVLRAENSRRADHGLRPLFVLEPTGRIGLVEFGLSARYRALETAVVANLAEQQETVRRDLLVRVGALSDEAFARVVAVWLEGQGHAPVEVVHRQRENVALRAQPSEPGRPALAVVARRAWTSPSAQSVAALARNLPAFGAGVGWFLTLGPVTNEARAAADTAGVRLVDGEAFAHALYALGVGVGTHRPALRYVDGAFFDSLE